MTYVSNLIDQRPCTFKASAIEVNHEMGLASQMLNPAHHLGCITGFLFISLPTAHPG